MFYEPKIFKNEEALSFEYLPEILPHRENQIQLIAKNIEPVARKRKPQNTFIFGPPGIGKTAVTKFVFREFEENYSNAKTIYINCWSYNTSIAILSKICEDLQIYVQRRGWAKDEILKRLIEALNKSDKGIVVALDEVDQLIFKDSNALYDLLRINQYVKNPFGLIFISNNPFIFSKVEPRIKSSLAIEEIEFKPYNLEEMKDILEERAKLAFYAFENGVILLASNHAMRKGGDVRVGLEVLMKAGRIAEEEKENKVKVEHAKKILEEVTKVKPKILEEKLNEHEKKILEILEEKELSFRELYLKYSQSIDNPVTERMLRNYLKHLQEINLIKILKTKGLVKKY
ncbi:MAG: AAA family ATPase [Candidatus Aenigmatarchaeota archaeon]